ncbi:hypothetical protein DFH06DRAFT_1338132 [Mycena polygramma]|nr:hypothetical protein DFH06DRAFT_1338132 [Mycena polygramma]
MEMPDVFSTASALREVTLTGPGFSTISFKSLSIPWAQITHYRARYKMKRHMEILRAAAHVLVECALGIASISGFRHHPEVVCLPRLRRLCVWDCRVVNHLEAPILETLTTVSSLDEERPMKLLAFIQRSSCTLTRLVMMGCRDIDLDELVPLLRELHALAYLFIGILSTHALPQEPLFHAMALPEICPNLTSFLFECCPDYDSAWDPLFAMVRYRNVHALLYIAAPGLLHHSVAELTDAISRHAAVELKNK